MARTGRFTVNTGWRLLLQDLGIEPTDVLRRAGLPDDQLSREGASLASADYFRFWLALEAEANDSLLPLRIGEALSPEGFDAPVFAALCSPDLATALRRIARFKPLLGPLALHVSDGATAGQPSTTVSVEFLDKTLEPPQVLLTTELVFFVQLARLATRHAVYPLQVGSPLPPSPSEAIREFFGRPIETTDRPTVVFHGRDVRRPFLTANAPMWKFFEPQLQQRLSELDTSATLGDRVRAALLELLPSGRATVQETAGKLAMSPRTLQRRLGDEATSFRQVLDGTRRDLANHYLERSSLSGAEIAFLLGFEEPSSFFRAFRSWTGDTPEQYRAAHQTTH